MVRPVLATKFKQIVIQHLLFLYSLVRPFVWSTWLHRILLITQFKNIQVFCLIFFLIFFNVLINWIIKKSVNFIKLLLLLTLCTCIRWLEVGTSEELIIINVPVEVKHLVIFLFALCASFWNQGRIKFFRGPRRKLKIGVLEKIPTIV